MAISGIGSSYTADEVYILETQVGGKDVPLTTYYLDSGASPNYTQPEAPAEYDPDGTYTAIQYKTEHHRYEAAYSPGIPSPAPSSSPSPTGVWATSTSPSPSSGWTAKASSGRSWQPS